MSFFLESFVKYVFLELKFSVRIVTTDLYEASIFLNRVPLPLSGGLKPFPPSLQKKILISSPLIFNHFLMLKFLVWVGLGTIGPFSGRT